MTGNQCFQIVKRIVASNFEDSGLDIYLLGYAMLDCEECLLLRADKDNIPQFYLYCPGNIIPLATDAFTMYGKIIGKIHCKLMENRDSLSNMAFGMEQDFAKAVVFAEDLKFVPFNHDGSISEHSIRDFRAYPPRPPAVNAIESYKDIYTGDMHDFVSFGNGAHASISDRGDFGDGDIALIHAEDGEGNYQDMLFPSKRVVNESGKSETIERLLCFFTKDGDYILKKHLKHIAINKWEYTYDKDAFYSRSWHDLYADFQLTAEFSGIHRDADKNHVYVYVECYEGDVLNQFIVMLPEGVISEIIVTDETVEFDETTLKTESIGRIIQRLVLDTNTIFELAKKITEPNCTEEDLNEIRDKISGKIIRRLLDKCPYCHNPMNGDKDIIYTVQIPVQFYMEHGTFKVLESEANQSIVEAVQAGRVKGECPYCHHIVSAKDIEPSKMGWKYMWRYNADA